MSDAATLAPPMPERFVAAATCRHCGTPVVRGGGDFCCAGCAGAFAFIRELGLERYYVGRSLDPSARRPRPSEEPADNAALSAVAASDGTASLTLLIDGLHCAACVWLIEQALQRHPAVIAARVNLTMRRLFLRWRGDVDAAPGLVQTVQRLGFRVIPCGAAREAGPSLDERELLRALAVAGFAAANVMLLSIAIWAGFPGEMGPATRDLLHWVSALIALPAVAYSGRPFFRSAMAALRVGRANMDVPISVGVLLATGMSLFETAHSGPHAYFESVAMLLLFLLVGRYLDRRARGRVHSAAEHLLRFSAAFAMVFGAEGTTRRVPVASLALGDIMLVAAGERIPADGMVIAGHSSVDKSLVDGESLPQAVAPGSKVLAGTLNIAAPLRVTIEAVGERTFLAEVARLMEVAERGRARLVVLADRVARRYAPAVHLTALTTFLGWAVVSPWQTALLNAVNVLIITCPCALGLAVPVVQVIACNRLFRSGVLLKSATALERLAEIDTVIFDKTGTLTRGYPELVRDGSFEEADITEAAALAAHSRHPLSRALCRAATEFCAAENVEEHPGEGLCCSTAGGALRLGSRLWCGASERAASGDTDLELWFARPGRVPLRFRFEDALRPDARAVVAELRRLGKKVVLLSGDRTKAVERAALELGIEDWTARVSPAEKFEALRLFTAAGDRVLMVGDGLNDGPALAAAHVSISPSSAADLCQTAADVVFQGASLRAVTQALAVARCSERLVRENIGFAILYNLAAVPLAIAGLVTPPLAAAAMSFSSIAVVANALRLGRRA